MLLDKGRHQSGGRWRDAAIHPPVNGHVDAARLASKAEVNQATGTVRRRYSSPAEWPRRRGALLLDKARRSIGRRGRRTPLSSPAEGHADAAVVAGQGAEAMGGEGGTPLWAACYKGQIDVARLLLDKAPNRSGAEDGSTPMSIAKSQGHWTSALLESRAVGGASAPSRPTERRRKTPVGRRRKRRSERRRHCYARRRTRRRRGQKAG